MKRTPFYDLHLAHKARMVPFAGFEMPVQYETGIRKEHEIVRTDAGVCDISHMGEFEITGPDRNAFVNRLCCNDFGALEPGQAQYTALLDEQGGFIDDCVVYRFDDKVMMVVNAANIAKDWEHVLAKKESINVRVKDISDQVALLAVQGPRSEALLAELSGVDLSKIRYYHFAIGPVAGVDCFISRTGYTGEDGFELYFRPKHAETVWRGLVGTGRARPVGLGARDSLRLEMGYPLYGNDIDESVNPYEARLGWIVKLDKGAPFVGAPALRRIKDQGVGRKLVGFTCTDVKAIPRPGYDVYLRDHRVDRVRSGGYSPSLDKPIGTTYLPTHSTEPGTTFQIDVRGRRIEGKVVKMPFYGGGSLKR